MADEKYTAIIDNFTEFAQKIIDFQRELETASDTAESMSKNAYQPKPSGFGYWINDDLSEWRHKYGDNVVGAAIEEIEPDFPELYDPHFFYWTTNEDIQEEIQNFVDRYADAFINAADRIKDNLDRIKEEQRQAEREAARKRAREQAERAREIEEKYKALENVGTAFEAGLSGGFSVGRLFRGIGKALSGFFGRNR